MIGKIKFWNKPILQTNINDFANLLNNVCKTDKKVAQSYFYGAGLEGNVSAKFLRKILPSDRYDASGNMSVSLRCDLKRDLKNLGLNKKATVREYFRAAKNDGFSFLKY